MLLQEPVHCNVAPMACRHGILRVLAMRIGRRWNAHYPNTGNKTAAYKGKTFENTMTKNRLLPPIVGLMTVWDNDAGRGQKRHTRVFLWNIP